MAAFKELCGDTILTKDGEVPTEEALAGAKAVAFYFSAHWCPPCRGFTPKLAEWYTKDLKAKGMEVVFVSADRDQKAFDEYYGEQPWLSIPYDCDDEKEALNSKFKVNGIPALVICGPDGKIITDEGRAAVSQDPTGEKFPWIPPTKEEKAAKTLELLDSFVDKSGATFDRSRLAGKATGLYFSAHWCPPCRAFTPKLADFYSEGLKDNMEIVFISSDRDQGSFDEYLGEMPWLALPFDKREAKAELSELFGVQGIPSFCVIDENGMLITDNGRSQVEEDPTGATLAEGGWLPQPLNDVNGDPSHLNSDKCIVVLNATDEAKAALLAKAKAVQGDGEIDDMAYFFFYASPGSVEGQIRKLTKTEMAPRNTMLLLDLGAGGKFYQADNAAGVTEASITAFIEAFESKSLEAKKVGQ
jgi:nucleoredoxin